MNKKIHFGLLTFVCILFTMNACSNDDDLTQSEMLKEITENATDRIADGLYGNVKTVDVMCYDSATWNKYAIEKGSLTNKHTTTYNDAGYYQEMTYYWSKGYTKRIFTEYDTKNRLLERITEYYMYSKDGVARISNYDRHTYTYDDNAKEATATTARSVDGINYTEDPSVVVYKLKDNGRIDYDNYDVYREITDSSLRSITDVDTTQELTNSNQFIQEKDNQGNWTKQYYKYTNYYQVSEKISISDYTERTITYY